MPNVVSYILGELRVWFCQVGRRVGGFEDLRLYLDLLAVG